MSRTCSKEIRARKAFVKSKKIPKTDYSLIAQSYDELRPSPPDICLSKIVEYGQIEGGCTILDIGCGTGRYPLCLATANNITFSALEPSIEMLRRAHLKDKSKRIAWIRGDGHGLPFKDESFDCTYMTLVIHHLQEKEAALREMHRVLKTDGNSVIMTISHSRIRKNIISNFPRVAAIDLKRCPTIPSLRKMMSDAGFKDIHHHIVSFDYGVVSTQDYLQRVRGKYISTLTLLSEDEFEDSFNIFQDRIKRKYGNHLRNVLGFVFVTGRK